MIVDSNTFYDFTKERIPIMVLGSYTVVKRHPIYFIFNVLCIAVIFTLYLSGVVSGIYTMIFLAKDKSLMVQAFYAVGLLFVSVGLHTVNVLTKDSLRLTTQMIRRGIYQYDEDFREEYNKIKRDRIKRVKFFVKFVSGGMFFTAFTNTIVVPLMQLVLCVEDTDPESGLNPFLPLHLFVPFDTRNPLGYFIAFLSNAITLLTMYASFVCHEELYICTTLQLTTELEILSFSLKNIEKRAYLKMVAGNISSHIPAGAMEDYYGNPEFQNCLYYCLRENIIHHHAIKRFHKAMSPYVDTTTTVVVLFFSFLMASAIVIMLENTRPQLTLITDIFGFLPMCWVGQLLANESSKTKHSLFDTPWPYCHEKFKVLLKVFMSNTQKPIMIRSRAFNINLCLETFADMVSVGYKIMNVMR